MNNQHIKTKNNKIIIKSNCNEGEFIQSIANPFVNILIDAFPE